MVTSTAVNPDAVARVVGIKTAFVNLRGGAVVNLPQRIYVIGQGSTGSIYSTTKRQVFTAAEVAADYGFGSPLHLMTEMLLPINGDGAGTIPVTIAPLQDDGSGVAALGATGLVGTSTESGALQLRIGGILSSVIAIADGVAGIDLEDDIADAISAVLKMPVTSAANAGTNEADLVAKWKGSSGNDISIEWIGSVAGLTPAITAMSGGSVNPDIQPALDQIGDVWETELINPFEITDSVTLDAFSAFGEGRWGALTNKPVMAWTGVTDATVAAAIAVSDARKSDRTNGQITMPGSLELPCRIAARAIARVAPIAAVSPPRDYARAPLSGLLAGSDADQWLYTQQDAAVKGGASTTQAVDGVAQLSDTVTFYHPDGDEAPAYRYAVDVEKVRNILFNLRLIFADVEWDGAPMIPDGQATDEPTAKQPKDAVTAVAELVDNLALKAIISDPDTAKGTIQAAIDGANPKRLNVSVTMQIGGNSNIISVDFNFGFFFG